MTIRRWVRRGWFCWLWRIHHRAVVIDAFSAAMYVFCEDCGNARGKLQ